MSGLLILAATPVTPVTSLGGASPNEGQTAGLTNGVTIPDGRAERAAIIEFEAGVPRTWAEGFAGLDRQRPLAGYSEMQWRKIIDGAGQFLDCWGAQAASLAWDVADVFGLDPRAPRNRYDAMGLVFLIGGGRVTALDERSATIQRGRSILTYTRCIRAGVCVWELDSHAEGAA